MLSIERKIKIAEMINKNGGIKTSDLSNIFNVSEMTILRDLASLEQEGVLKRVYGGAVKVRNSTNEISAIIRKHTNSDQKNIIAQKAIKFITSGESIFLDSSTTVLALAKKLAESQLEITVITNGFDAINELKENPNIKIICPGGELQKATLSFIGPNSENLLKDLYVDKAFISTSGVSLKSAFTVENPLQALHKKIMISNSLQKIILIDSSKFNKTALSKVCDFKDVDVIITDKKPLDDYIKYFKKVGIELVY